MNTQTLKINDLVIKVKYPKILIRKIEKLLIAESKRDWSYRFTIE